MKFDPDALNYVFSTEQEITAEERSQLRQQLLSNALKPMIGDKSSLMKTLTAAAVFISFLLAIIAAATTGHLRIAAFIFGLMFFIAGVSMLIFGQQDTYTADRNNLRPKQNAVFVLLFGALIMAAPLLIAYVSKKDSFLSTGNIIVLLVGGCFALAGGFFVLSVIAGLIKSSKGFGYETEGECIGYVRCFHSTSENHHTTLVTSPVYEYYYEGERLQAIGNENYIGTPPVAVGEHRMLNIDPKDHYAIFELNENQKKAPTIIGILFPLVFVIVGLALVWYGATQHIEPANSSVNNGKSSITDIYIRKKFGLGEGEWSIAEYTVTDMTEDTNGEWLIELSDGTFRRDSDGSFHSSHSVGYRFYELTDSSGTPVASFNAENWEYAGSKECVYHD